MLQQQTLPQYILFHLFLSRLSFFGLFSFFLFLFSSSLILTSCFSYHIKSEGVSDLIKFVFLFSSSKLHRWFIEDRKSCSSPYGSISLHRIQWDTTVRLEANHTPSSMWVTLFEPSVRTGDVLEKEHGVKTLVSKCFAFFAWKHRDYCRWNSSCSSRDSYKHAYEMHRRYTCQTRKRCMINGWFPWNTLLFYHYYPSICLYLWPSASLWIPVNLISV